MWARALEERSVGAVAALAEARRIRAAAAAARTWVVAAAKNAGPFEYEDGLINKYQLGGLVRTTATDQEDQMISGRVARPWFGNRLDFH